MTNDTCREMGGSSGGESAFAKKAFALMFVAGRSATALCTGATTVARHAVFTHRQKRST